MRYVITAVLGSCFGFLMAYGFTSMYEYTSPPENILPVELLVFKGTIASLNVSKDEMTVALERTDTERVQRITFSYDPDLLWELYELSQESTTSATLQKMSKVSESHANVGDLVSILRDVNKPNALSAERIFLNI